MVLALAGEPQRYLPRRDTVLYHQIYQSLMIAYILSRLFPPRLPSRIQDWGERTEYDEQGSVGKPQRKKYRDGIERHFAERAQPRYFATNSQYMKQLRNAEQQMQKDEIAMADAGYLHVQDEWFAPEVD